MLCLVHVQEKALPAAPRICRSVLKMSGAGYSFVQTSEGVLYSPPLKRLTLSMAMVEVARIPDGEREGGFEDRLRGRVVRVVGRAHETVVGRYEIAEPFGVVVPEDPRIRHDIFTLRSDAPHVKDGDIVRVRMTSFPSRREPAQGVVEEVLGHEGQPGADVELIIARRQAGNIVFGNIACRLKALTSMSTPLSTADAMSS